MKKLISTILCAALLAPAGIPAAADGGTDAVAAESGLTAGMEVTYNYPILTDPMQMSDEELFGAWSTAEEGWMVEPKFAYSEWPAMQAVEEAAKAGDYAAAKDALLDYYRTECSDRITQVYTHPGERALEQSLALARNFYGVNYGSNVVRKLFEVDNTMKERRIDVTSSIAIAAGSEQYRSFVIASVDQETTAEFLTKEGGFTSVLSMNVNGAPMELKAEADTYISAGGNAGQVYGAEPVMLASEGVTTQYISSTEDTRRCLIKFDVSGLSATDEINSATLIVKGRNASGTGIKELVLYQWADSGFSEDTVCWSTFEEHYMFSCNAQDCWDYVTSNSTLIKGKSCFYHRGNELQVPATLYNYTGDEAYAYTFIRQQMGLIHSIGYNPAVMNELDMSTHLDNTLISVFRVLPSEHMTGERFAAMFKHLWLIARWICEEYYGTRNNNYATFATLGGYSFLSHFREITDYDQWLLNTQNENDRVQGTFVREDGTSIELARGYQGTLLSTLSSPISRQRSTQNPDFPFTQYAIDNIRRLLHDFVYSASPGWKGFNLGDGNDAYTDYSSTYTFFYNNLLPDDQLLAYVVSGGTEGTPPEQTSMSFPYGLRTYLRSDWGDTADSLVFTAKGELNSSHGDSDLLSVAMFAHGQYLLIDPGYGSVLTGDIFLYMGSAQQHNTVTVNGEDHTNDGKGHAASEGREEEVELNDIYDFVTYSADEALSTAEQFRRSVAFVRDAGFWIVSDYIRQDGTAYNDYSQQWHMLPDANIQIDPDTKIAYSSFEGVNVQVVPVSPEDYTYVQLEETMYSPSSGSFVDNLKACYHQKTNAKEVVYTTLLVPENMDEDLTVEAYALDTGLAKTDASCAQIRITNHADGTSRTFYYYHLNDRSKQQTVTVGKYTTDASMLLLEEADDGRPKAVMLLNGTFLTADDVQDDYIYKSTAPLAAIAFKANGQSIDVAGSTLTAEEVANTTFYDYGRFKSVYANGERMESSSKNGYLYFGEDPIVEGTPSQPVTPPGSGGNTSSGNGHAGGSGGGGTPSSTPPAVTPDDSTVSEQEQLPAALEAELAGHWAEEEVKTLYRQGIVTGDGSGLRLQDSISRAEFTTLLVRALKLETTGDFQPLYADVQETDWYAPYVLAASEAGLVNGSDGNFRPDDTVTREELCKMLVAAYEQLHGAAAAGAAEFTDADAISAWALPYVQKATALGLVNGMEDGRFEPQSSALREQAFAVIGRLLGITD